VVGNLSQILLRQPAECFDCVSFSHVPLSETVARAWVEVFLLLHKCFCVGASAVASVAPYFFEIFDLVGPLTHTYLVSPHTSFLITRTILAPIDNILSSVLISYKHFSVLLQVRGCAARILRWLTEKINLSTWHFVHTGATLR